MSTATVVEDFVAHVGRGGAAAKLLRPWVSFVGMASLGFGTPVHDQASAEAAATGLRQLGPMRVDYHVRTSFFDGHRAVCRTAPDLPRRGRPPGSAAPG